MVMFSTFEHSVNFLYHKVVQKRKEDCSKGQQLGVTCLAGYAVGSVGSLISNPADNIVSSLYNKKADSLILVVKKIGLVNLFTRSLPIRIMLVGPAITLKWLFYAPTVLVTPLGALSIIISAVLAHFLLKERLQKMGVVGCVSCIVGSVIIVIHAPQEHTPSFVQEIWILATQPAFLIYVVASLSIVLAFILHFEPRCGQTNILIYLGICSLMGSLTVVSIKAIGIAIKLTLEGVSQIAYPQTWFFFTVAVICVITQLNYLNKALDTFDAAIVSPVYYVMFTTLTIIASAIMFKDWSGQTVSSIASEICGFLTVLSGTIILHATREQEPRPALGTVTWYVSEDSVKSFEDEHLITIRNSEGLEQ